MRGRVRIVVCDVGVGNLRSVERALLEAARGRRDTIVVTRDPNFRGLGAVVTTSLSDARAVATGDALRRSVTEIAVIGGAEIYAQWMDIADRLEITEVHARPEGDTYFAAIELADWEEVARVRNSSGPDDSADFSYVTYHRRRAH